jgi:hypothetical protein
MAATVAAAATAWLLHEAMALLLELLETQLACSCTAAALGSCCVGKRWLARQGSRLL